MAGSGLDGRACARARPGPQLLGSRLLPPPPARGPVSQPGLCHQLAAARVLVLNRLVVPPAPPWPSLLDGPVGPSKCGSNS